MVVLQTSGDHDWRRRHREKLNTPSDAQDGGARGSDQSEAKQVAQKAGSEDKVSDSCGVSRSDSYFGSKLGSKSVYTLVCRRT